MSISDVFWCTTCLNMSTRNRIEFDSHGRCNACVWSEEKKTVNWSDRENQLKELFEKHKNGGPYDLIIPVSGGKDSSYVAYNCKYKYGLNPLCVTVHPPTRSAIGYSNLENFKKSGYTLIEINLPYEPLRQMNIRGFVEQGRPLYGWTTAIFSAVIRLAKAFDISLIMYGENGEIEYGGSNESKYRPTFTPDFAKNVFLEGEVENTFRDLEEADSYFWTFPKSVANIELAHWSYYENWDSYRNYLVAKEHCGLEEREQQNSGTYTNFAQNDNVLYDLHTYLMYLKFGFGRATQDAGIDIRRGAMTRDQAIQLASLYDNELPETYVDEYLNYYQMSRAEFDNVLKKWVNIELFQQDGNRFIPKFEIV
jgi:N-acetyl sugar amidotransferase